MNEGDTSSIASVPARCSEVQPWRWITAGELPALPFTHFTHTYTHPFSIISLFRRHKHTRTGLKALTGLLAKGHCQDSDKSLYGKTETSHTQLNWKHTSSYFLSLMLSFCGVLFISVSPSFSLALSLFWFKVQSEAEISSCPDQFPCQIWATWRFETSERSKSGLWSQKITLMLLFSWKKKTNQAHQRLHK